MFAVLLAGALAFPCLATEPTPPKFTAKPSAAKSSDGNVKIEFAVDRETDVTVVIEGAAGTPVRHLVAGVLGKNPPPLRPGLAQSIEWDGKADWDKNAPAGPFKVRVALSLGAKYDMVVASDPVVVLNANGWASQALAAGPDGTLDMYTGTARTPLMRRDNLASQPIRPSIGHVGLIMYSCSQL